jgi:Glycosyl transferase family 2
VTAQITVAVASQDRALRLRWLLNALAAQTAPAGSFDVVVAPGSEEAEVARVLSSHPLVAGGTAHVVAAPPGAGLTARRNVAWRAAAAPLVAFCDDDVRPPEDWVERLLEAAAASPGAIVEGALEPDPTEGNLMRTKVSLTRRSEPPAAVPPLTTLLVPREVLEAAGGLDDTAPTDELAGLDLVARAQAPRAAAPEIVVYAAVHPVAPLGLARRLLAARHLPWVVARHPELGEAGPLLRRDRSPTEDGRLGRARRATRVGLERAILAYGERRPR